MRIARLAIAAAFVGPLAVLVGLGARQAALEGRAVEDALRAGYRSRLEAAAGRAREAALESETRLLDLLPRATDDAAAIGALEKARRPPADAWFAVAEDGALLHPAERGALRAVGDARAEAAARALLDDGRARRTAGDLEGALAAYRRFLERYPDPPLEPQARPLALFEIAEIEARRGNAAAARTGLLDLERELGSEDLAPEGPLVRFYREKADALAGAAPAGEERAAFRRLGVERARRARLLADLRAWLAARIRLEIGVGGGAAAGRSFAFTDTVRGERRRFVFRLVGVAARVVAVGFGVDPRRLAEDVIRPTLGPPDADGGTLALLDESAPAPALVEPLGPDLPPLRLALAFAGEDPAARAARTRRLALALLAGGTLVLMLLALALVLRHAERALELSRMKSDFVAGVSHELRTPLALIRALAETLELGHVEADPADPRTIVTAHRVGYRFVPPDNF